METASFNLQEMGGQNLESRIGETTDTERDSASQDYAELKCDGESTIFRIGMTYVRTTLDKYLTYEYHTRNFFLFKPKENGNNVDRFHFRRVKTGLIKWAYELYRIDEKEKNEASRAETIATICAEDGSTYMNFTIGGTYDQMTINQFLNYVDSSDEGLVVLEPKTSNGHHYLFQETIRGGRLYYQFFKRQKKENNKK